MMAYSRQQIVEYFRKKAKTFDLVDQQVYWRLSDTLLWAKFREVVDTLPAGFAFFDAGGGTGRWTKKLLEQYPSSHGVLFDLSEEMLDQARQKLAGSNLQDRVKIVRGDLGDLESFKDEFANFDICFNFHNVLGFVENPEQMLKNLAKITRPGGLIVSFVPNLYHAVFFNLFLGRIDEAEVAAFTRKGRFTSDMPYIHLFTPDSISELYKACSIEPILVVGFPVTVYPGYQETRPTGSSARTENILGSPEKFDRVLAIEQELISPSAAARGNNIFIVGRKPEGIIYHPRIREYKARI